MRKPSLAGSRPPIRRRRTAPGLAWAAAIAVMPWLQACELGLHEYEKATTGGCEPWQADCSVVLDLTAAAPINPSRVDIDRVEIVAAAAAAPYRQCDTLTPVCQGRIIADVVVDQYIMVLAGDPIATPTATPSEARTTPTSAASPGATGPDADGRIVRTYGVRAVEVSPVRSAPVR